MSTIEQLLKIKIQNDFDRVLNNKLKSVVTNDINLYLINPNYKNKLTGNEVLATLSTGNGQRSVSPDGGYITQSLAIYVYVPINYLQDCLATLTNYTNDESREGNVQVIGENEYSLYINYNTPTTDGVKFDIGINTYSTIVLMGTMIYSNAAISIGATMTISLDGAVLKNIIGEVTDATPIVDSSTMEGKIGNLSTIIGVSNQYILSVLYNPSDALHKSLKALSYYADSINSLKKTVTVVDTEIDFNRTIPMNISVKRDKQINGFDLLTITLTRRG